MEKNSTNMRVNPTEGISLETYNYALPNERIAKYPLQDRASCKLLVFDANNNALNDSRFTNIEQFLPADALLIRNNSRVIHARIIMEKATGARIEIFCLNPILPASYDENLATNTQVTWHCLIGNAKKWKNEVLEKVVTMPNGTRVQLQAFRNSNTPFEVTFRFTSNDNVTFGEVLEAVGQLPIPPYLGRATEQSDLSDYQTVYAIKEGSVAAPTAGLHFTPQLVEQIKNDGATVADVTLHVGAGTFLPVKGDNVSEHIMHSEVCSVSLETIKLLLINKKKTIAIGTTSVRTIESLYYVALNHINSINEQHGQCAESIPHINQWEPYNALYNPDGYELLQQLIQRMEQFGLQQLLYSTALFIIPGYKFHYTSHLITNFHQPKSTLLLMISAFIGDAWVHVYQHALDNEYRFLSYGDASLLVTKNEHTL